MMFDRASSETEIITAAQRAKFFPPVVDYPMLARK
jgi:hypothetical protein